VSTPIDSPSVAADRGPVQEVRHHLERALAALDGLHEVLPPPGSTRPSDTGGGERA
jgi:hypothetical protein